MLDAAAHCHVVYTTKLIDTDNDGVFDLRARSRFYADKSYENPVTQTTKITEGYPDWTQYPTGAIQQQIDVTK